MLKTTVQKASFPTGRRVIVISDIHGAFAYLQGLLKKIHFSPEDILVINGDIIERGPENLRCLQWLMELSKKQTVYTVCGNNDAYVRGLIYREYPAEEQDILNRYCTVRSSVLGEMRKQLGLPDDLPASAFCKELKAHFAAEFDFIANMPTILETPNFTFVHGGLRDTELFSEKNARAFDLMKFDDFLAYPISFSKPVVVGHWPSSLYSKGYFDCMPYVEPNRKIISIDGGCMIKNMGQLNAMILPDGSQSDYCFASFDLLPVKQALDDQAGRLPDISFCWPDCRVEMLEDGEEICLVRHVSSGKILHVLKEDLWEQKGQLFCDDSSNGYLPVCAGESVSVICQTQRSSLIKKNGKIGWYNGRLSENK